MEIVSYAPTGYKGKIVSVEIDIRRGIPGTDIVGLPGSSVRESRERVRVAVKNSGFSYPRGRILVNLAPADLPKDGTIFDLPIALSLLISSGEVYSTEGKAALVMGELRLDGSIRPVRAVLNAVAEGIEEGIELFIVPYANLLEACSLNRGCVFGVHSLTDAVHLLHLNYYEEEDFTRKKSPINSRISFRTCAFTERQTYTSEEGVEKGPSIVDFSELRGQAQLKRAIEISVCGRHNLLLSGPPGSGKTLAIQCIPSIIPPLDEEEAITVSRIYSLAERLSNNGELIRFPPFRAPHHSSTLEGILGGGRLMRPGEISLSHRGVLFLDEALEFGSRILQSLREPVEEAKISLARAGRTYWFPADFQLILVSNPCPCGNLGKEDAVCVCSREEIRRYWKRLGGPLLDRMDIRLTVKPVDPSKLVNGEAEKSNTIRERVQKGIAIQKRRFKTETFKSNSRIPAGRIDAYCPLGNEEAEIFIKAAKSLGFSARACASVRKLSRTIADLAAAERIERVHILEAFQHRRGTLPFS